MRRAGAKILKAVVLAAGKGTRMGDLTTDMPKAMIPVAGKPVLKHILTRMVAAGITDFVFVTRYLADTIEAYFGDGSRFGARIEYVPQIEGYGTGAALLSAKEVASNAPLIMTFADILTSIETYTQLVDKYMDLRGAGVMTLKWVDDPHAGAAVIVDDAEMIEKVVEKPPKGGRVSNWNAAGVYVFDPIVFDYLGQLSPSWRGEYELADALNAMIGDGMAIHPSHVEGDWLDVGTVEALKLAEQMLS